MGSEPPRPGTGRERQAITSIALEAHRLLSDRLGRDFYSVPALDMLLDLYLLGSRKPRSLTSLCGASDAPVRTALRTLNRMVDHGLLVRAPDLDDARRTNVELTPKAIRLLDGYFDGLRDIITSWSQ